MKTIKLTGTDAIQVRRDGDTYTGVAVVDNADKHTKQKAHRDAWQLIPDPDDAMENAQFAGAMIDGISITNCKAESDGKLQLIFQSDGGCTNVNFQDNTLDTNGKHFISVVAFSGIIKNNRDSKGNLVPIQLFPLRLGGNSDGKLNVFVLSFKNGIEYAPVSSIVKDKTLDHVTDYRFGDNRRKDSIYLHNFDLEGYWNKVQERQLTADEMRSLALSYGDKEEVMIPRKKSSPFEIGQLQLGQHELKGEKDNPVIVEYFKATSYHATDDETPWCSAVHCWVHEEAGVGHTKSAAALSWLDWGTPLEKPEKNCTIIADHGNGRGHVGFYIGETETTYLIMGGNQGDEYNVIHYSKATPKGWHFRKQKTAFNSKTNITAVGTGAVGLGTLGTSVLNELGISIEDYNELMKPRVSTIDNTEVNEKPKVKPKTEITTIENGEYKTLSCSELSCGTEVPEGYTVIPNGLYDAGMFIGVVLIGFAIFTIKERLKKINGFGI